MSIADLVTVSLYDGREDKVVMDEQGLTHIAVLSNRASDSPYAVAMCDMFDAVDKAFIVHDELSFEMPVRRWTQEQETDGMVTCLRCIGA